MIEGFGGSSKIAGSISGSLCCSPFGPLHFLKNNHAANLGGSSSKRRGRTFMGYGYCFWALGLRDLGFWEVRVPGLVWHLGSFNMTGHESCGEHFSESTRFRICSLGRQS